MKEVVVVLGEFLTVGGILLVATADLATPLSRLRSYLRSKWARIKARAVGLYHRLLRRQRPAHVVSPASMGLTFGAGVPRVIVFPGQGASLQQVLTYLSGVETRLSSVEEDLPRLAAEIRDELAKARASLESQISSSIAEEAGRFGKQRLLGTAFLLLGSGLLGWANFL